MKKDIILAGVGGQGILTIAAVIGKAALNAGLQLKQAEVHGMSQRGGDVHSNLRISDVEILSDLIPLGKADIIISIEPMESLRYLPMLSKDGWLITNTEPYINIANYPDISEIIKAVEALPKHINLDANRIAKDLGAVKVANIVILGAASPFLGLSLADLEEAIRFIFGSKGEAIVNLNLKALSAGKEYSDSHAGLN